MKEAIGTVCEYTRGLVSGVPHRPEGHAVMGRAPWS